MRPFPLIQKLRNAFWLKSTRMSAAAKLRRPKTTKDQQNRPSHAERRRSELILKLKRD